MWSSKTAILSKACNFTLLKAARQSDALGEVMTIGQPGASRYIVKGVWLGDPKADGYWTLDEPELQFQLSSVQHHVFREHFYIPLDTFKQTGPLMVDFYVNGHLLDQARFAKDGDVIYQHDVPVDWLKTDSLDDGANAGPQSVHRSARWRPAGCAVAVRVF